MRAFAQAPSAESTTRGNGSTFSWGAFAAILVCVAAFVGISAPAAGAVPSASPGWSFQAAFANGAGSFDGGGEARNTIAVDGNGNVLVANEFNPWIRVFAPGEVSGDFLTEVVVSGSSVPGLAVDAGDDALYYREGASLGGTSIRRYVSDGNPTPTYTLDPSFEVPLGDGFAVDPTTSDLLVADAGAEAVLRYETDGTLAETLSTPGFDPKHIAIATDGSIYVSSASGADVVHLSGAGAVLGTISSVGSVQALAWDPTDSAIVALVGDKLKTYSAVGVLRSETPTQTGVGNGLAYDSARELLYQNTFGTTFVYDRAIFPGVEAPTVSAIAGHGAHLSAPVDPGEGPPAESRAHFEYSDDGGFSWKSTPDQEVTVEGMTTIEADITGLLANQKYLVRTKASNVGATQISSAALFTTAQIAPEVEVSDASGVEETNAVLNGSVNPNGLQTTYYFEYGTTLSYGARVPMIVDGIAGNGRASRSFSQVISGLAPGAIYHYRLVARNASGQAVSVDRTFATANTGEIAPKRAYEQVTPVDKGGAQLLNEFHVQVADQGSAIAVAAVSGASDSESALMRQNFVIRRGPNGWEDWEQTDAPQAAAPATAESSTQAVSEDYKPQWWQAIACLPLGRWPVTATFTSRICRPIPTPWSAGLREAMPITNSPG